MARLTLRERLAETRRLQPTTPIRLPAASSRWREGAAEEARVDCSLRLAVAVVAERLELGPLAQTLPQFRAAFRLLRTPTLQSVGRAAEVPTATAAAAVALSGAVVAVVAVDKKMTLGTPVAAASMVVAEVDAE